jgi:hypothetical protein
MHSFHQSRGRILFEGLCALGISASLAGAWLQTEASALLPAASLALVYGLVRLSDMSRKPVNDAVSQEEPAPAFETVENPKPAAKPKASRPKAARKGGPREAKPPKEAPVAEPALLEEPMAEELPITDSVAEEMTTIPLEPLFEPQPFVRQQHAVFGRKARFG